MARPVRLVVHDLLLHIGLGFGLLPIRKVGVGNTFGERVFCAACAAVGAVCDSICAVVCSVLSAAMSAVLSVLFAMVGSVFVVVCVMCVM